MKYVLQENDAHAMQLCNLVNRAYRTTDGVGRWTTEHHLVDGDRITLEGVTSLIKDDSISFIAGFKSNKLVCCISVKHCPDRIELGTFAVDPKFQGQGHGKAALCYAEQFSRHLGKPFVVRVLTQNQQLIDFYIKRGYQITGKSQPYPVHENVGTPRQTGLSLTVLSKKAEI